MASVADRNLTEAVAHLTVAERVARGRAARMEVPRSSHGVFGPSIDRPGPIDLLERLVSTRVSELNERDYQQLVAARRAGRIAAKTGL